MGRDTLWAETEREKDRGSFMRWLWRAMIKQESVQQARHRGRDIDDDGYLELRVAVKQ